VPSSSTSPRPRFSAIRVAGLALGPVLLRLAKMTGFGKHGAWLDSGVEAWTAQSLARLSLAGLLVGFGSRVGCIMISDVRRADDGSSGQAVRGMYGVIAEQYQPITADRIAVTFSAVSPEDPHAPSSLPLPFSAPPCSLSTAFPSCLIPPQRRPTPSHYPPSKARSRSSRPSTRSTSPNAPCCGTPG
jgi:hypothetical protein